MLNILYATLLFFVGVLGLFEPSFAKVKAPCANAVIEILTSQKKAVKRPLHEHLDLLKKSLKRRPSELGAKYDDLIILLEKGPQSMKSDEFIEQVIDLTLEITNLERSPKASLLIAKNAFFAALEKHQINEELVIEILEHRKIHLDPRLSPEGNEWRTYLSIFLGYSKEEGKLKIKPITPFNDPKVMFRERNLLGELDTTNVGAPVYRGGDGAYSNFLSEEAIKNLLELDGTKTVFDVGSGSGAATVQLWDILEATAPPPPRIVAFDLDNNLSEPMRQLIESHPDKVSFILGDFGETSKRLPGEMRADHIIQVMSDIHYNADLSGALQNSLSLLNKDGTLHTHFIPRTHPNIITKNGVIPFDEYLNMCKGITFKRINSIGLDTYDITRTGEDLVIPKLELYLFESGIPPDRLYILKE